MITVSKLDPEDNPFKIILDKDEYYELRREFHSVFGRAISEYFDISERGSYGVLTLKDPNVPDSVIDFLMNWFSERDVRIARDGLIMRNGKNGRWDAINRKIIDKLARIKKRSQQAKLNLFKRVFSNH